MSIAVRQVTKRFDNGFVAVDNVSLAIAGGSLTALLAERERKVHLPPHRYRAGDARRGRCSILGRTSVSRRRSGGRLRLPALRRLQAHDRARQRGLGLKIRKRPKAEIRERVDELLGLVQLDSFADRYPGQLSGGQRQRMASLDAGRGAQVLLLDEPFGALDARVRKELRACRLHDEVHVTTVLVTHDQEEADVADRVTVMNDGRIEQSGKPRDLYEHPANEFVMSFVGPVNRPGEEWIRRTTSSSASSPTGRRAGDDPADRSPRLRGARRARARRRQARLGAGDSGTRSRS